MGFSIKGKEIITSSDDELRTTSLENEEESTEELVVPVETPSEPAE